MMATMKSIAAIALTALLMQQTGCEEKRSDPPKEVHTKSFPIGRFQAITSREAADVALDTKTGQMCRTWNWDYTGKLREASGHNDLPLCLSLFREDVLEAAAAKE
jgi:hypothetical protein